jgi:hypothetical protein
MIAAGVLIRTGHISTSSERTLSGLVQRFVSLDFIHDNASCFVGGVPHGGDIVAFGAHRVYIIVTPMGYPREVISFPDSPLAGALTSSSDADSRSYTEVKMASSQDCTHGPPLERTMPGAEAPGAGASGAGPSNPRSRPTH